MKHVDDCTGCEGTCSFEPAWRRLGLKSKEEGIKKVFDNLFAHKDSIISRGFSEEVPITVGSNRVLLKGKNPGRKKDR